MGFQVILFEIQLRGAMFFKVIMRRIGMKAMFTPCLQATRLAFPGLIDTRKARGFVCAVQLRIKGRVISPLAVGCLHYSNR
jgi:hypothetical protein